MKTLFTIIFSAFMLLAQAGDFKVKFQIETVDHSAIEVTSLVIREQGEEIIRQKAPANGDVKLKLEEGELYEVWIMKEGYVAHVIHNIHSEGDGKFKVTLYKTSESLPAITSSYLGVNREFDNVKEMTIPAELLGDSIHVVKEDAMSKDEQKSLSKIHKSGVKIALVHLPVTAEVEKNKEYIWLDSSIDPERGQSLIASLEQSFAAEVLGLVPIIRRDHKTFCQFTVSDIDQHPNAKGIHIYAHAVATALAESGFFNGP